MADDAVKHGANLIVGCDSNATMWFGEAQIPTKELGERTFPLHRIVLAASSGYFQNIHVKHQKSEIEIDNFDTDSFENVINYAYSGRIALNEENVCKIWKVSNFLLVPFVRESCIKFLIKTLKTKLNAREEKPTGAIFEDILQIWRFSSLIGNDNLLVSAAKYMAYNMKFLKNTKQFLDLELDQLINLLECRYLNVDNEEIIYEACIDWVQYKSEERVQVLPQVMQKVRLRLLSPKFLVQRVCKEDLIASSPECQRMLEEVKNSFLELCDVESRPRHDKQNFSKHIIVVGGDGQNGTVEVYNPLTKEWHMEKKIPTNIEDISVAVYKGYLFIFGGYSAESNVYVSTVEAWDLETKEWFNFPKMLTAKACTAVAVLNDCAYICGGEDKKTCLNTVECYNLVDGTSRMVSPMIEARSGASAVSLNGYIYVLGGCDDCSTKLISVERYDPIRNRWQHVEPMTYARTNFGAATLDGEIYVCGARHDSEVYNPVKDEWQLISKPIKQHYGTSLVSMDGKLWVIGGYSKYNDKIHPFVESYDPDKDVWTMEPSMIEDRFRAAAAVIEYKK